MFVPSGFSRQGVRVIAFWIMVILVVVADQATKAAVCHLMEVGDPARGLVPGLLALVHVENTGAAFSIGQGSGWLFVLVAAFVFIYCCIYVWQHDLPFPLVLAIGSVAGGGVGNMIDRIANGSVTDFLATTFVNFPVFNVADICVTCGTILSILLWVRWDEWQDEPESESGADECEGLSAGDA